jgi:hypothetical protein
VKLDDAKCKEAWAQASPDGNAILPEQAAPYVADYNIVDMGGDGSISWEAFQTACVDAMMNTLVEATLKSQGGKPPRTLVQPRRPLRDLIEADRVNHRPYLLI